MRALSDPEVEVLDFERNGYSLTVDAPRPGLVYCSDSYFRGWQARVNGRRARMGNRRRPAQESPGVPEAGKRVA